MKRGDTGPIKTVYYTDEHSDEFSSAVIQPKVIDENYPYLPKNRLWYLGRFVAYRLIAMPIAWLYCKLALHSTFRNRQVLKQVKGQGCFVFGNHTQQIGDAFLPNIALCPGNVYVIVHPNNVSMPGLGRVTPYLGALPLPDNLKAMRHFKEAIETRIREGRRVVIYPEAHIWPYYTGIREFPATSMKYPVELNAPSLAMTTTYRKRRFGKKPRTVTYLDGPFYPDPALPPRQRAGKLREEIIAVMRKRAAESDCEYIRYVKKEV